MNRKRPLVTERDIEEADPAEVSKLNIGEGLHLRVHKKGYKYFQLRVFLDRKDKTIQIGKHPEMTLAQAWEKANNYRAQMAKARDKKKDLAFRAKLKQQTKENRPERYSAFQSIEDAAQFIRNLCEGPYWDAEVGQALLLQLLIPARWNDVVHAQFAHFDRSCRQWMISQRRAGKSHNGVMHTSIAYLSQYAIAVVEKRHQSAIKGTYLFPKLAGMSNSARASEVAEVMGRVWPNYSVDPETSRSFFEAMANQHSYFQSELIDHAMSYKSKIKAGYRTSSYILQRQSLAEWWSNELLAPPLLRDSWHGAIYFKG